MEPLAIKVAPPAYVHRKLGCGVEFAADPLPDRNTVCLHFRLLAGASDEPEDLGGVASVVEDVLSQATEHYTGRALADAFDAMGVSWNTVTGRQTTLAHAYCLPEFALDVVDLIAEMFRRPKFDAEDCRIAIEHAQEDLRTIEDDPHDLLRRESQRITFGPVHGRHVGGNEAGLARLTPELIRAHWERTFHAGRMQITAAGQVDADALAARIDAAFAGFGDPTPAGREPVAVDRAAAHAHYEKDLKQQYMALTLPGAVKGTPDDAVQRVLLGVLSGGMSGRLFVEVREKQGLVYWVGAWAEQPRGYGILGLGASTTPERCQRTYETLIRELDRLSEDLTEEEVERAKNSILAHSQTEDDLTRARCAGLSDDLFHFSEPVGPIAKLDRIAAVTVADVEDYVRRLDRANLCIATVGPADVAV